MLQTIEKILRYSKPVIKWSFGITLMLIGVAFTIFCFILSMFFDDISRSERDQADIERDTDRRNREDAQRRADANFAQYMHDKNSIH